MSTDVAIRNKPTMLPQNLSEARGMAQLIAQSRLFGCKTEAEAFSLMLLADAEGLHPAVAARDYHIIEGRPTLRAEAMLARFQTAGGSVKWVERTKTRVVGIFSHPKGGENEIEWTLEEASRITNKGKPLTAGANWRNYPRQMLTARCIAEGVRATFPGVIAGYYAPEEIDDGVIIDAVLDTSDKEEKPARKKETENPAPPKAKPEDHLPGADILIDEIKATASLSALETLVARKTSAIISYGQGDRERIQRTIREKRASFEAPPPPPPPQEEDASPREEEVQDAVFIERDPEADRNFITEFVRKLHSKRVMNTVEALWDRHAERLAQIKADDPELYDEAIKADAVVRERLEDQDDNA